MKTTKFFIIPIILALLSFTVAAQQSPSLANTTSKTVTAEGVGETEESAIEDAKRGAVDQVCGMVVASWTEVRNFQTVKDVIFAQAAGFVKSWKLLSSRKEADDSYSVKIRVEVTEILDEVVKDEAALNLLLQWVNRPRILVAIDETIEDKPGSIVAETEISRQLQSKGFSVLAGDNLTAVKSRAEVVAGLEGGPAAAAAVGSEYGAEILVTGKAEAKAVTLEVLGNMKSGQANLSARILWADDGSIIAQETFHGVKVHLDPATAGTLALKDAASKMAQYLFQETIRTWSLEQSNVRTVRLRVINITFNRLKVFENYLKSSIRGIREVNRLSFTSGIALYTVRYEGSAEVLGTVIDGKSLEDKTIQVVGQTQNVLELKIIE